jgi:hypothetical protein
MNLVKATLHLEGLAVLAAAVWVYFAQLDASWIAFALLLLVPDLSLLGFLRDMRLDAVMYNAVHNYVLVIAVIAAGFVSGADAVTGLGLILAAHVGMDRAMGYGLKYPTAFVHTHLRRVGEGGESAESEAAVEDAVGVTAVPEMRTT